MLKHHLKTAWRGIFKNKTYQFINIGGLAVSMSVVMLIMYWIKSEATFDEYHKDAAQLYLLSEFDESEGTLAESSPYAAYQTLRAEVPEIALAAAASRGYFPIVAVGSDRFYEHNALYVDSNWTQLFDYTLQEGTFDIFKQHANQIAISHTKARQYFGNRSALGQTIRIDSTEVTVGAVFADIPSNSSFRQDVLIPQHILFRSSYFHQDGSWSDRSSWVVLKLASRANPASAAKKITAIYRANHAYYEGKLAHQELVPVTDLHLHKGFGYSDLPKGNTNTIRVFALLGGLLLLTACVNFVNLSISRASLRTKEVGVRKVAGASKRQLFSQTMAENIVAIAISMVLTITMVILFLPLFNTQFETHLSFSLFDVHTVIMMLLIFLIVLALTGVYPALLISNISPLQLFRGRGAFRIGHVTLRNSLLVGQLVLAIGMIISVLVIQMQFRFVQQQASGYQMDQVFRFAAAMPDNMLQGGQFEQIEAFRQDLQTLKSELLSSSAIKSVTRVNGVSLIDNPAPMNLGYTWGGYPPVDQPQQAVQLSIDHDYLSLANLHMQEGRWFDRANPSDKNNIVINETAVKTFGLKEPVVGTNFDQQGFRQGTVVGVVKDFHHASLHIPIQPVVLELDQNGMGLVFLVEVQAGRVKDALNAVAGVWKQYYPNKPFEYQFVDEEFDNLYKEDRKVFIVLLTFTSLSLLLSSLGILSMALFSAQQRVSEIGIRKVLGATVANMVTLLSLNFVKLALVAFVVASPIALWAVKRWLENFAYRINIPWWAFAVAGLAGIVLVLLSASWQAIRAATTNPVKSLRDE